MASILSKIKSNLKNGTFFKNGTTALRNRIIKSARQNNLLYFMNKERVIAKKYEYGIPEINSNHYKIGNYYLDKRVKIDHQSIVYSLGILMDIAFDSAISKKFGCNVFMYDPTPACRKFMKNHENNPLFKYTPKGVWTENTTLKFYEPKYGGSSSLMQTEDASSNYFEAECETMFKILTDNNHESIDVFKADIEGAALPILEQMVEKEILPIQIIVELERPQNDDDAINDYFSRVTKIRNSLKQKGYLEFLIPRENAKYFSLEFLFVKI